MSDVTKKLITLVLILLIAVVAIIGCAYAVTKINASQSFSDPSSTVNTPDMSAAEVNKQVIDKMGYTGISELNSGDISSHIDIPEDSVTQASVYISDDSSSAMEIACFKLADPDNDKEIRAAILDHIAVKVKGFQDSPKESEYIKNYVTATTNGYVFLVISENADVAAKAFEDTVETVV